MLDGPELAARLNAAADALLVRDIAPYIKLRSFVTSGMIGDKAAFIRLFSSYYGLNQGGLGRDLKDAYFRLLFEYRCNAHAAPLRAVLLALHAVPNAKGYRSFQASFASKLIAIHDETQPLYDRHVAAFFRMKRPSGDNIEIRIEGFRVMLQEIKKAYEAWSQTKELTAVINRVQRNFPDLAASHRHRVCDFLVWVMGNRLGPGHVS
jgi:hypothetical protein